jgi:hypothetical protein
MNVIGAIVRQHSALFRVMVPFSASLGARDVSRGNSFQRQTVADALVIKKFLDLFLATSFVGIDSKKGHSMFLLLESWHVG